MQSYLDVSRRPVIVFDAKNAEHRKHVAEFLKNGTWANCPIAFYAPDGISVKAYATETLVNFYLQQEFDTVKTRAKVGGKLIANKSAAV